MGKSLYDESFIEKGYELASQGLCDKDIAKALGISVASFYNYQNEHLEFLESLKKGKKPVDSDVVSALLKNALGFTIIVKKAFKVKNTEYIEGKKVSEKEEIVLADEEQYISPDTTAQIFWVKNRLPEDWRDKKEYGFSELPPILKPIDLNATDDSSSENPKAE